MSSQNRIGLILVLVVIVSAGVMFFSRDARASDEDVLGNLSVACAPNQRAIVQRLEGTSQVDVACVDVAADTIASVTAPQAAAGLDPVTYYAPAPAPAALPALTYAPAPVAVGPPVAPADPGSVSGVGAAPTPTPTPVVAATPAPAAPTSAASPTAPAAPPAADVKPSTQQRILVIGGTAGAGAGIGAVVGGRKGALIGAAIGAGGATVVDQIRNR